MTDISANPAGAEGDVAALIETLRAQGVAMARVSHCDLHGKCRSKELPIEELELATKGLGYCLVSVIEDMNGNPLDVPGFAGDSPFPDLQSVADLSTGRILPWEPDTVWFLADLRSDGGLSARGALQRTCARLQELDLTAVVAPELEFYLLRRGNDGQAERYAPGDGMAYVSGRRADPDGAVGRMHRALYQLGIGITAGHHEFSPGQFEINLRHGPAMAAADRAFLFKEGLRELACTEGLEANFMAKPFNDAEGSSLHLHVSLLRGDGNLFRSDAGDKLSPEGLSFIAGLLEHAPAITALASPTVNSYSRLVPGGLVPTGADWAYDNRFSYVRIPPERGDASRVEVRGGDASANPYLVITAVLAAGLDGIDRGLTPPPPRADTAPQPGPPLPSTLADAVAALEGDAVIAGALGTELVRTFCALKRDEVERRRRTVTDWDWREYARHA